MSDAPLSADSTDNLSQGMALHKKGDLDAAAACYARIAPGHAAYADSRHLLGLIAGEGGRLAQAEADIRAAIALRPRQADYHYNLGTVLSRAGQTAAAIEAFRQALRLKPQDAGAWNNLGNALMQAGEAEAAEAAFRQALKYDRRNAVIHTNLGNALARLGRDDAARVAYQSALSQQPGHVEAAVNMAALLLDSGQAALALPALESACAAGAASPAVLNALAAVLRQLGREAEAEPLLRRALQDQPDFAEGANNLALVLKDLGRNEEAERWARHALDLRPDYGLAHAALGNILFDQRRSEAAEAEYRRALALMPEHAATRWNLGLLRLAEGDLGEGWSLFESRLELAQAKRLYPDFGAPLWQGEALAGKRILLYAEQGLGDTLQFIRYAPLVAGLGAEVLVRCPQALVRLLSGMAGISHVLTADEMPQGLDYVCPIMGLPRRFATTLATIPASVPYLAPPVATRSAWAAALAARSGKPRIGLVWAGDPRPHDPEASRIDRRRSMSLSLMAPLLQLEDVEFHSLQIGRAARELAESPWRERVRTWDDKLADLAETAALLQQLDLLISVDTAVVHLAGALARPVWLLSRFDGCWRWLRDRDDSPWYPTLRLFRQHRPDSWPEVIAEVAAALQIWRRGAAQGS